MADINAVTGGQGVSLWMQTGANPTPLARSAFTTFVDITTTPGSTNFVQIPVKMVPDFGLDGQSSTFSIAGSPVSGIVTTQSNALSMSLDLYNIVSTTAALLQADALPGKGLIKRTFIVYIPQGANARELIFNGFVTGFKWMLKTNEVNSASCLLIPDTIPDATGVDNSNWIGTAVKTP